MEEEIEAKQKYLREEIIEQGYEAEIFSQYIVDLKGEDGFDLDNWAMNELETLVNNFKKKFNQDKDPNQYLDIQEEPVKENKFVVNKIEPENNYKQDTISSQKEQEILVKEQQVIQQQPQEGLMHQTITFFDDEPQIKSPHEIFNEEKEKNIQHETKQKTEKKDVQIEKNNPFEDSTEVVACNKAEKTILTDMSKLKVEISNPELIKNGIFSFAFLQFTITTEVVNNVTTRRLADFEWFYYKLHEMFPGVCIPFFPLKKMFEKTNDIKCHMKKKYYLQKFINALIKTKIIRTSKIFYDFIIQSREEWKNTRLALEKTQGPTNMSKFTTMEGIINISITKDLDMKALCIQRDINTKMLLYNKLNAALNTVITQINVMSQCFQELSVAFKELSKGYNESIFKNDFLDKGYSKLGNLINDWSDGYNKQKDFFKNELKYYFKFMKKELNCFNFIVDDFKASRSKYFDYFNKMAKVPFLNNQQHSDMNSLKKYYGFFMNRAINEYYRLQKNHMKRLKVHFDSLTERQSEFIIDYMSFIQLVSFNL